MKLKSLCLATAVLASANVAAAPIAIGPALTGAGDGLNAQWADVGYGIGSIAGARNAIATSTDVTNTVSDIDFSQNGYNGYVAGYNPTPAGIGHDTWAVEFSGYLNIQTSGIYDFNIYTDDGFELVIGGEVISSYNGNRPPRSSYAHNVALNAGLYAFNMVHWENGGVQAVELTWRNNDNAAWELIDDEFHTSASVSEPGTFALFGLGLLGLGLARRTKA